MTEQQAEQQDTEITLGMGKLLAFFFIAVAICGAFFGLGYSVGRSATPLNPMAQGPFSGVTATTGGSKPGAGLVAKPQTPDCATPDSGCTPLDANASTTTAAPTTAAQQAAGNAATSAQQPPANQPDTASANAQSPQPDATGQNKAAPELEGGNNSSIMVQVAAVTKQEDAEALVSALRRKNYPVFVLPNSGADKLFHVQVGPFAEVKDAEAMRSKLVGDGYNAFLKK